MSMKNSDRGASLPTTVSRRASWAVPAAVAGLSLLLANCASQPQQQQRVLSPQNAREIGAFKDRSRFGNASPRVVQYGQAVPRGGGRDHVGRPYRMNGRWYTPRDNPNYTSTGMASWYGDAFHGRKTANGEVYDKHAYSAAHPTMPLPSYARVTNLRNGHSIIVRVNDRGPFHGGRVIDVSERVANALNFKHLGTANVRVDFVRRAALVGSDDRILVSTLRTDGQAAQLPGGFSPVPTSQPPIMVASNDAPYPGAASSRPLLGPRPAVTPGAASAAAASRPVAAPTASPSGAADDADQRPVAVAEATRPVRRAVPLPPDRPFDLGIIPGAGEPTPRVNNGEPQRTPVALPGRAPAPGQRVAVLQYAPLQGVQAELARDNPMLRLRRSSLDLSGLAAAGPQQDAARLAALAAVSDPAPAVVSPLRPVVLLGMFRDSGNARRLAAVMAEHGAVTVSEVRMNGTPLQRVTLAVTGDTSAALLAARRAGAGDARLAP
jgi:rare lipoprotein A